MLRNDLVAWPWVNPEYTVRINRPAEEILKLEIDPSMRMADIERENNTINLPRSFKAYQAPVREGGR